MRTAVLLPCSVVAPYGRAARANAWSLVTLLDAKREQRLVKSRHAEMLYGLLVTHWMLC